MAPRSSGNRQDYFEVKAVEADQQAVGCADVRLADRWRHIAANYRWIGYYRRAFGKWQPHPEDGN